MNIIRKHCFSILLLSITLLVSNISNACTTFIISGKKTKDGKPILFKHRDTDAFDNAIKIFDDGRYQYVALVNARDDYKQMVWGGYNSQGFAIINSVSFVNKPNDTTKLVDQEGVVMKLALMNCKNLSDFQNMLDTMHKPMGLNTNFGVIDAEGGAAYYETGNFGYVKFDVNNIDIAPKGYLARTNHSYSVVNDAGLGYCRYNTECMALNDATNSNNLEPQYLFDITSRNLYHSYTKTNLRDNIPEDRSKQDLRFFVDYIPTYNSTSAIMIVGAPNYQLATNTVMWAIVGFPLTSVAVPVWLTPSGRLPKALAMKTDMHAPICDASLKLKKECFPIERDNGHSYINLAAVINQQNSGYLQMMQPIENTIFGKATQLINDNNKTQINKTEIEKYYNWLDNYLNDIYYKLFKIQLY